MLFLLLPLLTALFPGGDSDVGFEDPVSFHLLQTSTFNNHSWVHQGSGWFGELQTHSWNRSSGTIIFLYPWSRGNMSNKELMDLERLVQLYFMNHQDFYISQLMFKGEFPSLVGENKGMRVGHLSELLFLRETAYSSLNLTLLSSTPFCFYCFHLIYFCPFSSVSPLIHYSSSSDPFDLQVAADCERHSGKGFLGFVQVAIQGYDFISFQNETWSPPPMGGRKAQKACSLLNLNQVYTNRKHWLLSYACPRLISDLLDGGKAHLQRQVNPEVWLSSGPSPGPGHQLLVCHVSGFYPKPVWVMWMRGEQGQLGTQRGDILPNADGTWYLQATLDVAAGEAAGLACRVKHSSLGGQDLVLHWAPQSALGLILFAVIVALVLLTGLGFCFWKRWWGTAWMGVVGLGIGKRSELRIHI
ncbi:T-cell surface glycoprotein CD1a-like [Marmota flaviventris]|uniref:T-cell surface glycoprotein CD1a-like n=1 Tax=Marmota flaviventris TaxID=93162 RepID=UPI003A84E2BD